jgi:hypothetical protein
MNKHTDSLLEANKDDGPEANAQRTKNMFISRHQNT